MTDARSSTDRPVRKAFRKIFELSVGDFTAKALNFLAFVFLARILGVEGFGILEFANSLLLYCLLLSDAGLEGWSIREIASRGNVRDIASRVTVLRLMLAGAVALLLITILPLIPDRPPLRLIMVILSLCLFPQAANLKWVFMGQQKMKKVATGLVSAQIVFTATVFAFVRTPAELLWVPVLRFASDVAAAFYFAWRFVQENGGLRLSLPIGSASSIMRPSLKIGATSALSMLAYNFDLVFLGFLVDAKAVGLYSVAYKPVTIALAIPMTYFMGLYPTQVNNYARNMEEFRDLFRWSLRISAVFSIPLAVGGTMMAEPMVLHLFGSEYVQAIPVLRLLIWSAVPVILRGTFRQGLTAANRLGVNLRCAMVSVVVNVGLNILLIPVYGIIGAATATLFSEFVWLTLVVNRLNHYVIKANLLEYLWQPMLAGAVMAACLLVPIFWITRGIFSVAVYFCVLLLLGKANILKGASDAVKE